MRYSASEKYEILQLVENSGLSVRRTLTHLGIRKSSYYNWLGRFYDGEIDGLEDKKPKISSS